MAALLDGTHGVVRLLPNRLEWISDVAAKASVQLEVAHVASVLQSKASKPNPRLKVTATPAAGGVSETLRKVRVALIDVGSWDESRAPPR